MTYEPRSYWNERPVTQGPSYVGPGGDPARTALQTRVFEETIERLLPRGSAVLDFGCGPGRLAPALLRKAPEYFGVDISTTGLALAKPIPGASFLHLESGSSPPIPLPDESIDVAAAVTVFQHITDDRELGRWCSEIRRVLKPGGWLLVIDHQRLPDPAPHMKARDPDDVGEMLGMRIRVLDFGQEHWSGLFR